jgi:hypothetical protein
MSTTYTNFNFKCSHGFCTYFIYTSVTLRDTRLIQDDCKVSQALFIVTPNTVRRLKSVWKGEVGPSKNFRFLALLGMTEQKGAQSENAKALMALTGPVRMG